MATQMNLEDALQLFMRRVDILVSMEMGGKLPTKQAYKEKRPVIDVAAEQTELTVDELKELLNPVKLTRGGLSSNL